MKKTITCLLLTTGLTGYLSAQTPFRDKSDKNEGKVIHMDKQMFLDNIFDYTVPLTGNTKERNRQLLISTPHGAVPAVWLPLC